MAFGWTWEYIDQNMTLPRLQSMNRYWKKFPPMHVLVAGYLGVGAFKEEAETMSFDQLLSEIHASGMPIK